MEKNINEKAPVLCSKSVVIRASPEKIWATLTNINNWTNWQPEIKKAKLNGSLRPQSTFEWKARGSTIHSTIHTVELYKALGWTGKALGILAIHNWTIQQEGSNSIVSVNESMEGLLAGVFKNLITKNLAKDTTNWLQFLKDECEKLT
ncbi:MAG: SRPBCC family protein [Bacteroidota bacterium]|nr:SRPBCC family protein [Bacteroidota bacterium]